ncbi:hypothetical protein HELRODRAFT_77767, partial [Helobdella robusta]|uniref:EF-hand domain-containing protein n=1 Tax=Helobdella robusta TaxID=6412 RepID=T1G336_HELRO
EIREAFNEYDLMGLETIPAHDFGDALRLAGQAPSESEVQEMLKLAVLDDTGCLTFDEFVKAVGQRGWMDEVEVAQELEDALRYFDKEGNGWLDAQEMRNILKTHGEPLDDDDVTEMVKLVDIKNNGRMDCNGQFTFLCKLTPCRWCKSIHFQLNSFCL